MVSDKKWAANLTEDSSYTMNAFSCCFQDFLLHCLSVAWLYCVSLWLSLSLSSLKFIGLFGYVDWCFSFAENILQVFFLLLSLFSFWDSYMYIRWYIWWCPTRLCGSFIFLHSFFFCCCSLDQKSRLTYLHVHTRFCLLRSAFEPVGWFISDTVVLNSTISICFLFITSVSFWYSLLGETSFSQSL